MVVLSSFPPPTDGIKHEQPNITVLINDREIGKGTVFIAESRFSWVNARTGKGFSLEYPHICLHAVTRTPIEGLFLMLDADIDTEEGAGSGDENSDAGSQSESTELRLVPDDKSAIEAMFQAMSECQALHPDPNESISGDEDIFQDADGDDDEGEYHLSNADEAGDVPYSDEEEFEEASNGRTDNGRADNGDDAMETEAGQYDDAESDVEN